MLRDCLRGVLDLTEYLYISTGADSENVSFSWALVANFVLTLFENKSNLGFRHGCCRPLNKVNQAVNVVALKRMNTQYLLIVEQIY